MARQHQKHFKCCPALSGTVIEQWLKEIHSAVQNDSRRLAVN
jgi:hypothetical protein